MTLRRVRAEAGFTLIELLVAMAAAIPVLLALFTIFLVTLHQSTLEFTRVSATSSAGTAMATVENELHSACVGQSTDPILPGSTPTSVSFLAYTGTDDSPTPVWHVLSLVANPAPASASDSLIDTSYGVTPNPNSTNIGWTQGARSGSVTVLTNVTPLTANTAFQYYSYMPYASGSLYDWIIPDATNLQPGTASTFPNSPLTDPSSGGLSTTAASTAVEVKIGLLIGAPYQPGYQPSASATSDPVTDSVSLRLTTPPSYSTSNADTGDYGPCQ